MRFFFTKAFLFFLMYLSSIFNRVASVILCIFGIFATILIIGDFTKKGFSVKSMQTLEYIWMAALGPLLYGIYINKIYTRIFDKNKMTRKPGKPFQIDLITILLGICTLGSGIFLLYVWSTSLKGVFLSKITLTLGISYVYQFAASIGFLLIPSAQKNPSKLEEN